MKASNIFDYFSKHPRIRGGSLVLLSVLFVGLLFTLHFSEDISDFLPLGTREREQLSVYQNISGADRLILLFSNPNDIDYTVEAIDCFVNAAIENDSHDWSKSLTAQIDMETITNVSDFVYENIPYFLTERDLERMDSLLTLPGYIKATLSEDKQVLMFPSSSVVASGITHDQLRLFSPILARLQTSYDQDGFELYDDYIFTPDMSRAVVMLDSPFGSSETSNNSKLLAYLEETTQIMHEEYPNVAVDIIGAPAIAVENSTRIKKDSILAISLSVVLILILLAYSFNSIKNILLIFLTVGWGFLFALGGMSLFRDNVSIIVIGIASVILGIAINYPLHLISHTAHQPDRRMALKEIISPLVVGNITTVGAFLALVPLKSTALRDLGLFASLLLVGTILFVLVYLPHYISVHKERKRDSALLDRLSAFSPENKKWIVISTILVTIIFLFFSFQTGFDSNMSHINYMTESQIRDMQYLEDLMTNKITHTAQSVYIYGSGGDFDEALNDIRLREARIDSLSNSGLLKKQNDALLLFSTKQEQSQRINLWNSFIDRHHQELTTELQTEAKDAGFASGAFSHFDNLIKGSSSLTTHDIDYFEPLLKTVFNQNYTVLEENRTTYVVSPVNVEPQNVEKIKGILGDKCFEVSEINGAMTRSLSDNFNYIGWACSLIVFFFLWFSFGRIEMAIISFLPMAISWIWILGLMAILGIKFNIVNIILATFIFGQGDDYTIFMTEGCQYEYSRKRSILKSYKCSILQSAAIMFVGIGTLIVAKHPAMRSLAEVTIIGMFSVVLMAYLIPPLLFKSLTTHNGEERKNPITIKRLIFGEPKEILDIVKSRYTYKGKEIEFSVRKNLRERATEIINMETPFSKEMEFNDDGYGELALLLALSHPDIVVTAHLSDEDRRMVALAASNKVVDNLVIKC